LHRITPVNIVERGVELEGSAVAVILNMIVATANLCDFCDTGIIFDVP